MWNGTLLLGNGCHNHFTIFYSVTIGRRKLAFILSYCFINIFVLANIVYSRFFNQYFNFDVLGESANFQGTWWITYLPQAFRWSDTLLLLTTILFICGLRILKDKHSYKNIFVIFLIYIFAIHAILEAELSTGIPLKI